MSRIVRVGLLVLVMVAGTSRAFSGDAAEALRREFGIDTYTATREADNVYEIMEGYVILTTYCYEYSYSERVVITDNTIIFIDGDATCDIQKIYRR